MDFVLTQQFTDDLESLPDADQRRVKDAVFKIRSAPDSKGLNSEKLKKCENMWSYRATQNIRIIARREGEVCSLVAVGRHDKAYDRAESGSVGASAGAETLAVIKRSRTQVFSLAPHEPRLRGPLREISDERLCQEFGVPVDWISALRSVADRDALWGIGIENAISDEAFFRLEALMPIPSLSSTGAKPMYRLPSAALARAFVEGSILDLQFNLPASSWSIIESAKRSPILVKGGPGSGKTLVSLYRALHILDGDPALSLFETPRVLYVTFTNQLCDDARNKIVRLRGSVPSGLTISTYDSIAEKLAGSGARTIFPQKVGPYLEAALEGVDIEREFFESEITECIQWRNFRTADEYERALRRGRGGRLGVPGRRALWSAYEGYRAALSRDGFRDLGSTRMIAADAAEKLDDKDRYDFVIVDEVQDLPLPTLIMISHLGKGQGRSKSLMLVGDAGQAIYNRGFRWADVGLRIGGGNVHTLAQSERSTQEILKFTKAIFGAESLDLSDDVEATTSSKSGERPRIIDSLENEEGAHEWLAEDVRRRITSGICAEHIAVIAHSHGRLASVGAALKKIGLKTVEQGGKAFYGLGTIKLITAHAAKGLEFREVYLPDVNDGVYPFYKNKHLPDDERADRDVQDCQLLYVAATRAAERLTILYDRKPSRFLENAESLATRVRCDVGLGVPT